ncbi:MAG: DUF4416 family protein [Planctomycetota bacterium]|jgi:hypothetical protein
MGRPREREPVQLIAGLIVNPAEGFERVRAALEAAWGTIELESDIWPFDYTDYYAREMGEELLRRFYAFRDLRPIDGLHRLKLESNEIELALSADSAAGVARPVNIDPGYISLGKLVLFSTKNYSHRIYIGDGIFAEITLEWRKGAFVHKDWTYPDYRTAEYNEFFTRARSACQRALRSAQRE